MLDKNLKEVDYAAVAEIINCEVEVVKAVAKVESNGSGFLNNGRPKILFEAHIFSRLTGGIFDKEHPQISSPYWNRKLYQGGEKEYERLKTASELDKRAAMKSASWGKFQIMGFNYHNCGFDSVVDFVADMYKSEREHLLAFMTYCQSQGLFRYLKFKEWDSFARKYNGPGYKKNRYAAKLREAYEFEKEKLRLEEL